MIGLLLHLTVVTSIFYLSTRAAVSQWLWSRYPRWLANLLDCAACSGFWWSALVMVAARVAGVWVLPLPWGPSAWVLAPCVGLIGTPLLAYLHQEAMMRLGTAVEPEEP